MAIVASNLYSGRVVTGDSGYPLGKAQDIVNGEKGTGTPLRASWVNDQWGFLQALLDAADITPSGTPDQVGQSDYLDAVNKLIREPLALKIFQSPTDGGLTEIQTRTVEAGEVYEVRKTSDDSLATIYSDAAGTTEIVQDGTDNKSDGDGVVGFYIADGKYLVNIVGSSIYFTVSTVENKSSTLSILRGVANGGKASIAFLGDSTTAGVGAGGGVYGELNGDFSSGAVGDINFSLMQACPSFTPPEKEMYGYQGYLTSNITGTKYPRLRMTTVNGNSDITYKRTSRSDVSNDLFLFIGTRHNDEAARAMVTVFDSSETQVFQEQIDSWVPSITFNGASAGLVGLKLTQLKLTDALASIGANSDFRVVIDSLDVIDRGNGLASFGELFFYGVSQSEASMAINYGIGSTTLKNESAANVNRGITTDSQFQKAYDAGCKVFFINFGTNDSKDGVSTVEDFESEYELRIQSVKDNVADPTIILMTAPLGAGVYENNGEYNEAIRRIAVKNNLELIDVEPMFSTVSVPNEGYYADDVHPNELGYRAEQGLICSMLGIPTATHAESSPLNANSSGVQRFKLATTSDFSGSWVSVLNEDVRINSEIVVCGVINVARASDIEGLKVRVTVTNNKTLASVVICEQIVNIPAVGGLAIGQLAFNDGYKFSSSPGDVNINLELSNYGIRSTESSSVVTIEAK